MKKTLLNCALVILLGSLGIAPSMAQDERFDIVRFQVEGNTLLPDAEVQRIVAPLVGTQRVYGDIQKALEALEGAYRRAGFSTVQVFVPEQELTTGVVRLDVIEGVLGKVVVTGNKYFDVANIRAALPALKEGKAPNLREMSENIQLSNESPAKQVEVTLGVSEEEGKVDAKVSVADENPQRVFMTADNTGTKATGNSRVGVAYQNANLFKLDHTLTLAYTGSADAPEGVKVDIFSLGYRVPLYGLGDSLDFIYGKSSVNTPTSTPALGGLLGIVGKGDVAMLRLNHYFARRGEYSSKLIIGADYKYIDARCSTGAPPTVNPVSIDPPTPPIASCVPYTTRPVSFTYTGQQQSPGQMLDYSIGVAHNFALGTSYTNIDGTVDRYSYLTSGNRHTKDDFNVLRLAGSYLKALPSDWQVRLAFSGQAANDPLVAVEQIGLAGSTAVRGFYERAVAADSGYFVNAEIYTPELGTHTGLSGNLRALAFYDLGRGYNKNTTDTGVAGSVSIASIGAGVRYSAGKNVSLRFDLAQVVDAGPLNTKERGDWRGHVYVMIGF